MYRLVFYAPPAGPGEPPQQPPQPVTWPFSRQDLLPWKCLPLQRPEMSAADMRAYAAVLKERLAPPFAELRAATAASAEGEENMYELLIAIDACIYHYDAGEIAGLEAAVEEVISLTGEAAAEGLLSCNTFSEVDRILSTFLEECRQPEYPALCQFARYVGSLAETGWVAVAEIVVA
jgi:hypothetical protein